MGNVFNQIGALAQAARNYLLVDSKENKAALDRLAAEALGTDRLYALCLDCGALVDWGCSCPECGLGEDF